MGQLRLSVWLPKRISLVIDCTTLGQSHDGTKNYLELPLPIEFKRPPSTGRIELVM
jgi:hypothetical protein